MLTSRGGATAVAATAFSDRIAYRPDIDGLRAIAVVMVVGYHVGMPGFTSGFTGVDLFFVISGWLIIGQLMTELRESGHLQLVTFFARRVRRLVPAAIVMMLTVILLGQLLLDPLGQQQGLAKSAIAALGFGSNAYFFQLQPVDYFGAGSAPPPLLHMWSLSVEEQFYVLGPLGLVLFAHVARRTGTDPVRFALWGLFMLAGISFALATWAVERHPAAGFYLPVTRAYEFILGGLGSSSIGLISARARRFLPVIGIVALAATTCSSLPQESWPGPWALMPVLAGAAVLAGTQHAASGIYRGLASAPLVWLGKRSYGWYLWHWPLLALAQAWNLGIMPLGGRVVVVVAALALAHLSYTYVEQPARQATWASTWRWRAILAGAVASTVVAVAAAASGLEARATKNSEPWRTIGDPSLLPLLPESCPDLLRDPELDRVTLCRITAFQPTRPTVVLWGDSHAWHLAAGLQARAETDGVNLIAVVRSGCPPYDPAQPLDSSDGGDAAHSISVCDDANRLALTIIEESAAVTDTTVLLSARWEPYLGLEPRSLADRDPGPSYDQLVKSLNNRLTTGLAQALRRIELSGARSELVLPTPEYPRDPARCHFAPWRPFECEVSRVSAEHYRAPAANFLRMAAKKIPSAAVLDLLPALCTSATCPIIEDGQLLYMDDDHLSLHGSKSLAVAWKPVTQRLLARY